MRIMGLDVGDKTVGVAVSDELGFTGQGITTIRRTNLKADLDALKDLLTTYQVERVVVGLPLNMDGSEGPRAEICRRFGAKLEHAASIALEYWDERLSTASAQRVLLEADVSRKKRREVVDKLAAVFILQSWLDAHRSSDADSDPEPE